MMPTKYIIILLTFFLISCGSLEENVASWDNNVKENLPQKEFSINWLVGQWKDTTVFNGRVSFCENWREDTINSFSGEKYQISKGDTSSRTQLALVKTDGKYFYTYFEEEEQVTFVQDSLGENYISFVNTKDQFPTNLSYNWNRMSMKISFSGIAKGVFRSASFNTIKAN
jgi:hypothetical protein